MAYEPTTLIAIPCLKLGGTEMQTLCLARALTAGGWKVSVLVYYDEVDASMRRLFLNSAVAVTELGLQRSLPLLGLLRRLVRAFRDAGPDIIHVQYIAPGFTPILAARLAGFRRIVGTVHQSAYAHGWRARRILRAAAAMCDVFVCNSLSTEKSWFGCSRPYDAAAQARPRGHCTLYNGVDVKAIASAARNVDRAALLRRLAFERDPVIGSVGRLRAEKGQETAIRATAALLASFPKAGLLLAGDGPDRKRLEGVCERLGIRDAVRFAGEVPPSELHGWYGAMDVLAVPSAHEGFGLVAAEAMAAGVPVVASDAPALAEVLDEGRAGLLFPRGDTRALAAAIGRVLSDRDLAARIRDAGANRATSLFGVDRYSQSVVTLHRALLMR